MLNERLHDMTSKGYVQCKCIAKRTSKKGRTNMILIKRLHAAPGGMLLYIDEKSSQWENENRLSSRFGRQQVLLVNLYR